MNCKNCGARLKDDAKVCQNCGAFIDDGSGYVLLTDNYKTEDVYSDIKIDDGRKKHSGLKYIISLILVVAIVGAGAYFYFTNIYKPDDKPSLSLTSASGIINDDEKIVYVLIPENSRIEFIHGVSLYDYDRTSVKNGADPISTSYEYTKSIDGSFRAIFFDVGDYELSEDSTYTYTFEINLSFVDNQQVYAYRKTVDFKGGITENAADIIFDHSLDEVSVLPTAAESTTEPATTTTTTQSTSTTQPSTQQNIGFIYNSFWFTEPVSDGTSYDISAIKFSQNSTYSETHYHKQGNGSWSTTTVKGKYEVKDGELFTTDSEGQTQSYPINPSAKSIEGLVSRKYNSIKNAEDFFGL